MKQEQHVPTWENTEEVNIDSLPTWESTEEVASNLPEESSKLRQLQAGLSSFGQGATVGFGEEIGAALLTPAEKARQFLSQYIPGTPEATNRQLKEQGFQLNDPTKESQLEIYRRLRDTARQEQSKLEQEYPKTTLAGEIAGGIAPVAIGGPSVLGTGIKGMAKAGAIFGGVQGLGKSEADLTKPSVSEILPATLDIAKGAALGGTIGGTIGSAGKVVEKGISAGKKIKDSLKNIETFDNIMKAFKYGSEGKSIIGKSAKEEIQKDVEKNVEVLVGTLKNNLKEFGAGKEAILKQAEQLGKTANFSDDLDKLITKVDEIDVLGVPKVAKSKQELLDLLNAYRESPKVTKLSPRELDEFYRKAYDVKEMTAKQAEIGAASKMPLRAAGEIVKTGKEKSIEALGELKEPFQQVQKGFQTTKEAIETLAPKIEGDTIEQAKAQDIMAGFFEKLESETRGGDTARRVFKRFMEKFEQTNPEQAKTMKPQLMELADRYELNRRAMMEGGYSGGLLGMARSAGITAGAISGKMVKQVKDLAHLPKESLSNISQNKKLPAEVQNFMKSLANSESPSRKQALLFSASQNPKLKKSLEKVFGENEDKE